MIQPTPSEQAQWDRLNRASDRQAELEATLLAEAELERSLEGAEC